LLVSNADAVPPQKDSFQHLFEPFKLACESKQTPLMIISLEVLGKLFTFNYFVNQRLENEDSKEDEVMDNSPATELQEVLTPAYSEDELPEEFNSLVSLEPLPLQQNLESPPENDSNSQPTMETVETIKQNNETLQETTFLQEKNQENKSLTVKEPTAIKWVVDLICSLFAPGDQTDVRVQLQILKVIRASSFFFLLFSFFLHFLI
jgi:hypothetical protein